MIDTHIHLESEQYDADRNEVIGQFFEMGGRAIINVGTDEERIKKTLEITNMNERIFAAVGFHPQEAYDLKFPISNFQFSNNDQFPISNDQKIKEYLKNIILENTNKIVAIGEVGLDYVHASSKDYDLKINDEIKKAQKKLFIAQMDLARQLKLPVIIHTWNAQDDCLEILKDYLDLKMVFHCYGRDIPVEFTKKLLKHENIFFSFTGNITYPRPGKSGSEIFEHLRQIPLEKIMMETDGPYLAPAPHRGKRNEPSYIKHIIEKIAEIKDLSAYGVEKQTDKNAVKFFGLKLS